MINVCFAGVTGWTAAPIVRAIDEAEDLVLAAGVSRSAAGRSLEDVGIPGVGVVYGSVTEALRNADVDVLVDYTSATAVKDNVQAAVDAGVHVVIGSSGLTAEDYAELNRRARRVGVGVFAAGNFSVMAAVLQQAARLAARHLGSWEILDYASDTKPDVPSGTARELAETLGQHPIALSHDSGAPCQYDSAVADRAGAGSHSGSPVGPSASSSSSAGGAAASGEGWGRLPRRSTCSVSASSTDRSWICATWA